MKDGTKPKHFKPFLVPHKHSEVIKKECKRLCKCQRFRQYFCDFFSRKPLLEGKEAPGPYGPAYTYDRMIYSKWTVMNFMLLSFIVLLWWMIKCFQSVICLKYAYVNIWMWSQKVNGIQWTIYCKWEGSNYRKHYGVYLMWIQGAIHIKYLVKHIWYAINKGELTILL